MQIILINLSKIISEFYEKKDNHYSCLFNVILSMHSMIFYDKK